MAAEEVKIHVVLLLVWQPLLDHYVYYIFCPVSPSSLFHSGKVCSTPEPSQDSSVRGHTHVWFTVEVPGFSLPREPLSKAARWSITYSHEA